MNGVIKKKLKDLHFTQKYPWAQRPERVELDKLFASLRTVLAEKSASQDTAKDRSIYTIIFSNAYYQIFNLIERFILDVELTVSDDLVLCLLGLLDVKLNN